MLEEYQLVKNEIVQRETALTEQKQEIVALIQQQEEMKQEVEILLAEIQGSIQDTQQQIQQSKEELAAYEARIAQQKAYEAELEKKKDQIISTDRLEEIKRQEEENTGDIIISDSESDIAMLAAIIESEAGNQSYEGMLAVGSVVMNRVRSSNYPNTIVEVLYAPEQFAPVASGRFAETLSRGAKEICVQAAREVLSGHITVNSLYFKRNNGTVPGIVIGDHVFY